jgi:YVTN family beta-propeller protein
VDFEGRKIPGLGEPNVPESFSVWGVDVSNPQAPRVISRLKTGLLVGATSDNGKTVGGSAPNFLAAHGNALFVSNGNNDMIERIDLAKNKIVEKRRLVPSFLVSRVRGVSPAGMVVSPDGKRLYVTEMGINAIAVLDAKSLAVLGHIPTAWYPYRVALSPDGRKLVCICFRGFGNGPNAGKEIPKSDFLGMRGVVSILDVPSDVELKTMTAPRTCWPLMESWIAAPPGQRCLRLSSPRRRESCPRKSSMWCLSPRKTTLTTRSLIASLARSTIRVCCGGGCTRPSRATVNPRWKTWE